MEGYTSIILKDVCVGEINFRKTFSPSLFSSGISVLAVEPWPSTDFPMRIFLLLNYSTPVFNTLALNRLLKRTNAAPIANPTAPMITKTYEVLDLSIQEHLQQLVVYTLQQFHHFSVILYLIHWLLHLWNRIDSWKQQTLPPLLMQQRQWLRKHTMEYHMHSYRNVRMRVLSVSLVRPY